MLVTQPAASQPASQPATERPCYVLVCTERRALLLELLHVASSSDDYLLQKLITCRLPNLAGRGLDGTMGKLSDGQRQPTTILVLVIP